MKVAPPFTSGPMTEPYFLSPTDVQTLRTSVRWRVNTVLPADTALIRWSASDSAYVLHAYGHIQAQSADPAPLLACLRAERAEPGFIQRILDARQPCDVASLAPDLARAAAAKRAADAAHARALDAAALELRRRSRFAPDPANVDLDDLV